MSGLLAGGSDAKSDRKRRKKNRLRYRPTDNLSYKVGSIFVVRISIERSVRVNDARAARKSPKLDVLVILTNRPANKLTDRSTDRQRTDMIPLLVTCVGLGIELRYVKSRSKFVP